MDCRFKTPNTHLGYIYYDFDARHFALLSMKCGQTMPDY